MNTQALLDRALEKLEAMSSDEFEAICIEFGYHPVKKIQMHNALTSTKEAIRYQMVSKTYTLPNNNLSDNFSTKCSNDRTFLLAA